MRSEGYQDTNEDDYILTDNQNNINALSLTQSQTEREEEIGDKSARTQFLAMGLKAHVGRVFNKKFWNAVIKLFKPCLCGQEQKLIKEQLQSLGYDDDDEDAGDGAEMMQDDGMLAEVEGRQFNKMKKCLLKQIKRLPKLALKYVG